MLSERVLGFRDDKDPSTIHLGRGLLTISPVFGEALVKTALLAKRGPRGPLFLADSPLSSRLPRDVYVTITVDGAISLNWLKGEPPGLRELQQQANLAIETEKARVAKISRYIESNANLCEEWKASVFSYLLA